MAKETKTNKKEEKKQERKSSKEEPAKSKKEDVSQKLESISSDFIENHDSNEEQIQQKIQQDVKKAVYSQPTEMPKFSLNLRQKLTKLFSIYLTKAGFESEPGKVSKNIFFFAMFVNFIVTIYVVFFFALKFNYPIIYVLFLILILWLFIFALLLAVLYLLFFLMLDFRIFKRTSDIEEVLPDFLELTSANIRAGMPIDQALWMSIRPRFGVLAKEIEIVAKETLSGEDLETALLKFTSKYDSAVLDRSINLLIEGMRAGGELGYLINRISNNIQESRAIRKEMSANVTTYVIFITFASIVAAPVLFALSGQLLTIVGGIVAKMATTTSSSGSGGFSMSPKGIAISKEDFAMFSMALLVITAFFSALIVAIIKKGSIKPGLSYIPRFIAVSLIIYWISSKILVGALSSLI